MSLRAYLKEHTQEVHANLETTNVLKRLTAPDLTIDEYVAALRGLYHMHFAFDQQLAKFNFDLGPVQERVQLGKLRQDLEYFGQQDFIAQVAKGDFLKDRVVVPFQWVANVESVVGAVYVIEGSTLGGMVIAQALAKNLQVTQTTGGRFFAGDHDLIKNRWLPFTRWLDQQTQMNPEKVMRSAQLTFEQVSNFF